MSGESKTNSFLQHPERLPSCMSCSTQTPLGTIYTGAAARTHELTSLAISYLKFCPHGGSGKACIETQYTLQKKLSQVCHCCGRRTGMVATATFHSCETTVTAPRGRHHGPSSYRTRKQIRGDISGLPHQMVLGVLCSEPTIKTAGTPLSLLSTNTQIP